MRQRFVTLLVLLLVFASGVELEKRFQIRDRVLAALPSGQILSVDELKLGFADLIASFQDRALSKKATKSDLRIRDFVGRVVKVVDGDSIEIVDNRVRYELRLAQIDAPEWNQRWGAEASAALREKIDGKKLLAQVTDIDRYNRLVANLYYQDRFINSELVVEGHVWVYRRYLDDRSLLKDERAAKRDKLGLWGASDKPVPPWDWR